MTRFVVDCSVSLAWCLTDETEEFAKHVLVALNGATAHVPAIWPLEMANGLLVAERRKRMTEADTLHALDLIGALPIRVDEETHSRALGTTMSLAREHKLSAYVGAYLELAMRLDLPLASRDLALIEASERCGVSLLRP